MTFSTDNPIPVASFLGTNGRAIYVNPDQVAGVIAKDKGSTLIFPGAFFFDVVDSADKVAKTLGWHP